MSNSNKIINYHVGGRAGSIGFPINKNFSHEMHSVIFDADTDCIDQIKEKNKNSEVKSLFVGAENKELNFFINYCPYTSSSYLLNSKYKNFYHKSSKKTDYLYENVIKPVKKLKLTTRSLDALVAEGEILPADFISLDAQGSEYDILINSPNLIKKEVLAINCEVSFAELYKDSKLFDQIDKIMKANGFFLVDLIPMAIGYHRIPNEFRGKGIPLQAEALYLKDITFIDESNGKYEEKIKKLAYIAITFGFTEYAYKVLTFVKSIESYECDYSKFLKKFFDKINSQIDNLPKLWNDEFTFEDSVSRFEIKKLNKKSKINIFTKLYKKLISIFLNKKKYIKSTSFSKFLNKNGFDIAATESINRINGKL